MKASGVRVLAAGVAAMAIGIYAQRGFSGSTIQPKNDAAAIAVERGAKWLVSVQGQDGGWGQDGGETSYVRQGEHLESNGNDVANTAVAATALLHAGNTPIAGQYHVALQRAVNFILRNVEQSPAEGLTVTDRNGTQIQRKLGPFIDTFLSSKLLAELDGNMGDARMNARVRQSLQKCVAKIEKNQLQDGSWNVAGGWAPILGTSMASRSLYMAQQKGVAVSPMAMAKVDEYTQKGTQAPAGGPRPGGRGTEASVVSGPVAGAVMGDAASAGVPLYKSAQTLEQLREFFSYLNISDGLHRAGGQEWEKWNGDMKTKVIRLQNEDGTWSGQHCITGRVAVTSAAMLLLQADRDPVIMPASARKK